MHAIARHTLRLQYFDAQDPLNLCRVISTLLKRNSRQLGVSIRQADFLYFKKARAVAADSFVIGHASQIIGMSAPQQERYLLQFQTGNHGIDTYRWTGRELNF